MHQLVSLCWLVLEDGDHELNPVVKSAWLDEEGKQAQCVAHVEDFGDQDELLVVEGMGHILDGGNHILFQNSKEVSGDVVKNLSLVLLNLVLEGSHQLLQGPETNELGAEVGATDALLDVFDAG